MRWCDRPAAFAATLALLLLCATAARAADRCAACHARLPDARLRTPAEQVRLGPHADEQLGCATCHGGDRDEATVRAHSADGFDPRPSRDKIPKLCGGCHADPRFIRRFNATLTVDQLALYETSNHGQRFAQGDTHVAVCTSCHGTHDITRVAEPQSSVHPSRVAQTCARCHADHALMKGYNLESDQFDKWSKSVHGIGIANANYAAATCTSCHGSHGATPPAVDSVARVCGRCHREQLERFRASPHARPFQRLGIPECEQCHGNHGVSRTSQALVGMGSDAMCGKCHPGNRDVASKVEQLAALVRTSRTRAETARTVVDEAAQSGLPTSRARGALRDVHTAELRLANVMHEFDVGSLDKAAQEVSTAAARAEKLVTDARAERVRKSRGYMVVAGLLLLHLILLLIKIKKTPLPRDDDPPTPDQAPAS